MASQFFLLDAVDIAKPNSSETSESINDHPAASKHKHKELYDTLLKDFAGLPKPSQGINHDNYVAINVAPAVVPNPYLPSFRIFVYNITGTPYTPREPGRHAQEEGGEAQRSVNRLSDFTAPLCANPAARETWRCKLDEPWHSNETAPSRTKRLWSPVGYAQVSRHLIGRSKLLSQLRAQYWLPALDESDEKKSPKYKLEYLTFPLSHLHPLPHQDMKPSYEYPIPLRHLPRSLRNATITSSKYAPYEMEDLTIPSWTELAQRLARAKGKNLGKKFRKYMYMGADEAS